MTTPSTADPVLQPSNPPVYHAVNAQFFTRPGIDTVIRDMFKHALEERYPTLTIDLATARLATPLPTGGWELPLLMDKINDFLVNGAAMEISHVSPRNYYFLSDREGNRLKLADDYEVDMQVIEALIKELPWSVPIGLKTALADYWSQQTEGGVTRWRWLSNVLKDTLAMKALEQSSLSETELETLQQVLNFPDSEERISFYGDQATRVFYVQSTLMFSGNTGRVLNPHLLLVRYASEYTATPCVLMCQPNGEIEAFNSVDAVTQSRAVIVQALYAVDTIVSKRYEVDGDAFDAEAALILNKQMNNITALRLPNRSGLQAVKSTYQAMTNPAQFFRGAPAGKPEKVGKLWAVLPDWMVTASREHQEDYRSWSLALAQAKKNAKGLDYLSGVPDLHSYTVEALKRHLRRDQLRLTPQAPHSVTMPDYDPDHIELTFLVVSGTVIPGSTDVSGVVERIKMTLTDLAIKNLAGKPEGELISVQHRQGVALPAWLTADYITQRNGLIQSVDIGRFYPQTLKSYLLDNSQAARKREAQFSDQLRWYLPLHALELSLRKENGMTTAGANLVAALMHRSSQPRQVNGQRAVIRNLALLSHAEAKPDVVCNMFIIEPANLETGPHVLYRPMYVKSLQEFASRAALMNAIAHPGELQTSVLTWMTDSARTVYDNGGFLEPHYVRFSGEDDFPVLFGKPEPASLATEGVSDELTQQVQNNQLMAYLYRVNALALIHQADSDTVSNRESRWALFIEGASLIFNTFMLPYLRGPLMLTAWWVLLVQALNKDIPGLSSNDPVTRELAIVDMLQTLAMVLFQSVPAPTGSQSEPQAVATRKLLSAGGPRRVLSEWPPRPEAKIMDGPVRMAGEWQQRLSRDLDFSFASASNRLSPNLRLKLEQLAVPTPVPLPLPAKTGVRAGLYPVGEAWFALIEGGFYPVRIESDGVSIEGGPPLQTDGHGHWSPDLRLRLRGGAPGKQIKALRERKAQRIAELASEYEVFVRERQAGQVKINLENTVLERFISDRRRTPDEVLAQRERLLQSLDTQLEKFVRQIALNQERKTLGVAMPNEDLVQVMDYVVVNTFACIKHNKKVRAELINKWAALEQSLVAVSKDDKDLPLARRALRTEGWKALIQINEHDLRWFERIETYMGELPSLGERGKRAHESLSVLREQEPLTSTQVKGAQIGLLGFTCTTHENPELQERLSEVINSVLEQVHTHDQLNQLELPLEERLAVLGSVVEQYGKALDALFNVRKVNVEDIDVHTFDAIVALMEGLYKGAELQLADDIKPLELNRKKIKKDKVPLTSRPLKRIIKTRHKGRLIGDLKSSQDGAAPETVEVRSDTDNKVLSTYVREGDNWNVVAIERTAEPAPLKRGLADLKREALKLYGMAEVHLKRAEGLINSARYPQEAEEILLHVADRLGKSASDLEAGSAADTERWRQKEDQELVAGMRARALDIRSKAHNLRVRLSLKLPPTHGSLQYLLEHQRVSIELYRKRQRLKRDFIDEYAIKDRDGNFVWCAHFHYKEAGKAKHDYEVAHLKRWSQRTDDYWSLKDSAKNQHEIVEVYRSQIGKNLADQWFLPLTT